MQAILKAEDSGQLSSELLRGKFPKKTLNFSHSVVFGWDGGFYVLLNKISNEEFEILVENDNQFGKECKENVCFPKFVIEKSKFGKIQMALALSHSETAPKITPGEVICLKKTMIFLENQNGKKTKQEILSMETILHSTWNDYFLGETGNFTFSPIVYDMLIIPCPKMKFRDQSLREILRTEDMVHVILEVLPEILIEKQKINRRIIYGKYLRRKMETVWAKKTDSKNIFMEEFCLKEDELIKFIQKSAELLAKILHQHGSSKINNESTFLKEFLDRHHYISSKLTWKIKG